MSLRSADFRHLMVPRVPAAPLCPVLLLSALALCGVLSGCGPVDSGQADLRSADNGQVGRGDSAADDTVPGPEGVTDRVDDPADAAEQVSGTGDADGGHGDSEVDAGRGNEVAALDVEAGEAGLSDLQEQDADPCASACLGFQCGTIDGCSCGDCPAGQECSAGGLCVPPEEACKLNCATVGYACGALTDLCDCGVCTGGLVCLGHQCKEDPCPTVCKGLECGVIGAWYFGGDYCNCGTCAPGFTCDYTDYKCTADNP